MTGLYNKKEVIFQEKECDKRDLTYDIPDGGSLELIFISIGPAAFNTVRINLGRGCSCTVYGLYIATANEKAWFDIIIDHSKPESYSKQLFKGILSGNAHSDFYGLIKVESDSQKTEAYQENHTLLLSDSARAETKPQLEIYADDVKCSHGATVGRLNDDELFYLRSRGITFDKAKKMQQMAFLSAVTEHIEDAAILEAIENKLNTL